MWPSFNQSDDLNLWMGCIKNTNLLCTQILCQPFWIQEVVLMPSCMGYAHEFLSHFENECNVIMNLTMHQYFHRAFCTYVLLYLLKVLLYFTSNQNSTHISTLPEIKYVVMSHSFSSLVCEWEKIVCYLNIPSHLITDQSKLFSFSFKFCICIFLHT